VSLIGRFFGYRRDDPDPRDHRFLLAQPAAVEVDLPVAVDLHQRLPPAWHQEQLSSCTGHACAGLMAYLHPGFLPSRLQLYYAARAMEGRADRDGGAQIRSAMKAMQKVGVLPEDDWPYEIERVNDEPPSGGERRTIAAYSRLTSDHEMLSCLALGQPFVLSMMLPADFDSFVGRYGVMVPPADRTEYLGNHAMLAVGYDLDFRSNPDVVAAGVDPLSVEPIALPVRNSFGPWWGLQSKPGNFWLPLSWLLNRSTGGDCWTGHKLFTTASEPQGPTVAGVPVKGQFQT
jgi:C1A family cysteine protease